MQAKAKSTRTRLEETSWGDVDEALFESLRQLRRAIAAERGVAAFVILHDATLRELASVKPTVVEALRHIRGFGERKLNDFGERVVECIRSHR
jgi:ATP-dependent DNA helicase RecQ